MSRVELDELSKRYNSRDGSIVAVEGLSLDIEDGEFVVLVGPSGCGKSTTLRCIAGLESVTGGRVRFGGEDVTDRPPKDRDVAMVFQNYALYPHMTARKNMAFGLRMSTDLSDDKIDERVEEAAAMMDIGDLLGDKPRSLSGGQQQRVALGRAIVRDPDVFLMDEPLSNLDAKLRAQMRTELQELQQELDVTTIYVTHDQTEAMTMGDRVAVLNEGRLQQIGTPLECYHRPENRFVAGFIGSPPMNSIDVRLEEGSLVHPKFRLELSEPLVDALDATELVAGVRPEQPTIDPTGDDIDESGWRIPANVVVVEPMGSVTNVTLTVGGTTLTVTTRGHTSVQPGDEVAVHLPEEGLHLFDRATGETIRDGAVPCGDLSASDRNRAFESV